MREICTSGSEGGASQTTGTSLPLFHFRRVAAKTNALVGCGGGLSFGKREPIGVGCELDLLPFLHGEGQVQHGSGTPWRLLGSSQSQGDVSQ